ncbi:MAG: IS1595 family transposase [Candidatus Pacebacteria bacterium]|nr:IS1595 family transposase [Candidatus Paceibacterota bacterium]
MTFVSSLSQIPDEKQIRKELKKIIFGKRVKCPCCGRAMHVQQLKKNKLWRCRKCRNRFSLTSVTWLKGMKISIVDLYALIWCWQKKMNVQQACNLTELSIPTARRYYELFRDNLKLDFDVILEDKVQMDEAFVKKAFIMGMKDIKHKRIKLQVVMKKAPDKHDAMELIYQYVKPGSTLQTDGGSIYSGCENWWPLTHKRDIHKKFEFGLTSEIEGIWANLRTFIRRMYHHVTVEKLPKIVAEFEARFMHKEIFDNPLGFLKNSLSCVRLAL